MLDTSRLEYHLQANDYAISMAVQTYAEIEGMKAVNAQRLANGEPLAYDEKSFLDIAINNGMNHNDSITRHTF